MREGYGAVFLDFDPERGIPPGRDWERELYAKLRTADAVLFLGSPAAVASQWCFAELALARSIGTPVVPILVARDGRHPLLGAVQWLDLTDGTDRFDRLGNVLRGLELDPDRSLNWDPSRPPYPGLRAFEPEDAGVFFGREDEIKELMGRLQPTLQRGAQRLIAVVGPSGSGKSSMVKGGLVPRLLKGGRWGVVPVVQPGERPTRSLARALARALNGETSRAELEQRLLEGPGALIEAAERICDTAADGRDAVLLVIDQAEELATLSGAEERARFVDLLRGALVDGTPLWAVATIRSEFLDAVLSGSALSGIFNEPQLLGPLDRARLFDVVQKPAERAGLDMDAALVAEMVDDTVGGDALPLLAYTLRRLWERCQTSRRDGRITSDDYKAIGGVVGSLRAQADEIVAELRRKGQDKLVLPVLTRLATIEGDGEPTRRRVPRDQFDHPPEREVVQAFIDARLLTSGEGEEPTVEVAHEALLREWPPLREAIESQRSDLQFRSELERAAEDWKRSRRLEAYLLPPVRLRFALEWASRHQEELRDFPAIREFLERAKRHIEPAPSPDDIHYSIVLKRMVSRGGLVPILGSLVNNTRRRGESQSRLDYPPDAEDIAVELARVFGLTPDTLELAEVAQDVVAAEGRAALVWRLSEFIGGRDEPGPVHRFLAALPRTLEERGHPERHQLIVTMNFDAALECAFEAAGEAYDLAVYVAGSGQFIHIPWVGDPVTVDRAQIYAGFPIDADGDLQRSVIVKPFGGKSRLDSSHWYENLVITLDDLDEYMQRGPAHEFIPPQILAAVRETRCLFLGHDPRDRRLRVLLRKVWTMGSDVAGWAVERDADVEGQAFWKQYNTDLHAANLADYVSELDDRLRELTFEQQPAGRDDEALPASVDTAVQTAPSSVRDPGAAAPSHVDTPFVGLSSYGTGTRLIGREAERDGILSNLRVARLTLLYSTSGAGVSSLLRAGVVPRLVDRARRRVVEGESPQYVPVIFSSWGDDPLEGLIAAIEQQTTEFGNGITLPRDNLDDAILRVSQALDATVLLLLDQFEEYVLSGERGPFHGRLADELARSINRRDSRASFLIAIREDAYAALGDLFAGRIPNVYGNYLRIEPLSRDAAARAIEQLVWEWNERHPDNPVSIEPQLVEAVLDEVQLSVLESESPGRISTTLMQLVMLSLWERERSEASSALRLSTLASMGGAHGILKTYVASALASLSPDELDIATDVLAELIGASAQKLGMTPPDLAEYTGRAPDSVNTVLEKLDQGRLVRVLAAAPGRDPIRDRQYEIFHEMLAAPIRSWLTGRRDAATRQSRRRWPLSR